MSKPNTSAYAYTFSTPDSTADDARADLVVIMPGVGVEKARQLAEQRLKSKGRDDLVHTLSRTDMVRIPQRGVTGEILEPTIVYDSSEAKR